MKGDYTIDVVIPSFRLDEEILHRIVDLSTPVNFTVVVYIISDNPKLTVPQSILNLYNSGKINLVINETNIGFSASRNMGIRAGNGKWILLLDDDIIPNENLLISYANAIAANENAIGFAGVTFFSQPFNAVTKALEISGATGHFKSAQHIRSMKWAPTANIVLNRYKILNSLFDETLKAGGEDIDFLVKNSLHFNENYISVPGATVEHPWWNKGKLQTARMFRYGIGAADIAIKDPIKNYTYRDFLNTSELLLLLLLILPFAAFHHHQKIIVVCCVAVIILEFITNYLKAIIIGKTFSPVVAFNLSWLKNCREAGYLYGSLAKGHINNFAARIDMGFTKPHPTPFRLNRWKIIKMLILVSILLIITIYALRSSGSYTFLVCSEI